MPFVKTVRTSFLFFFFFFKPQKSRKPRKTRVLKYGGEVEHKRGEGETVRLMATEERVFHFQTYCILVQKKKKKKKCSKEMPPTLFWQGSNSVERNWPCFQCNTQSCRTKNNKPHRVQVKFPSPYERQKDEGKDDKDDMDDEEDDEDDEKKKKKKKKKNMKKKKTTNTHTKLEMDELLLLLWGCHTDMPVKNLSEFLAIDPSTITAYKQACVDNVIVLVEEMQAGMTLGGPGKEVEMDEFSVGIIHFVQTDDAGSTIDKCAYQRLIGATERGSRKCFLKTLPIVHQNWLQPNETVTLPSGAGNFTNKRAKKVPPPPPPLSIPELREFLDEGFLLLGTPEDPVKLTTDGAGAYRSMLDPTKPNFYWKDKIEDAEKCVEYAWVNHGKEEFTLDA